MNHFSEKIEHFISLRKIAVTGVSSITPDAANLIFKKLRDLGYEVFAVNPRVNEVEGSPCYCNLSSIPHRPEGVVMASPPSSARPILEECILLGINNIWIHSTMGTGSYDAEAVSFGEKNGLNIIPVGCPMMYYKPVDFAHKCLKWMCRLTGKIPGD